MGAACCSRDQPLPPETSGVSSVRSSIRLTIYGDYFDRDTRALLAICDMSEVVSEFAMIDTFNGGNLEASYSQICPT